MLKLKRNRKNVPEAKKEQVPQNFMSLMFNFFLHFTSQTFSLLNSIFSNPASAVWGVILILILWSVQIRAENINETRAIQQSPVDLFLSSPNSGYLVYGIKAFETNTLVIPIDELEKNEVEGIDDACNTIPILHENCKLHPASCQSTGFSLANLEETIVQCSHSIHTLQRICEPESNPSSKKIKFRPSDSNLVVAQNVVESKVSDSLENVKETKNIQVKQNLNQMPPLSEFNIESDTEENHVDESISVKPRKKKTIPWFTANTPLQAKVTSKKSVVAQNVAESKVSDSLENIKKTKNIQVKQNLNQMPPLSEFNIESDTEENHVDESISVKPRKKKTIPWFTANTPLQAKVTSKKSVVAQNVAESKVSDSLENIKETKNIQVKQNLNQMPPLSEFNIESDTEENHVDESISVKPRKKKTIPWFTANTPLQAKVTSKKSVVAQNVAESKVSDSLENVKETNSKELTSIHSEKIECNSVQFNSNRPEEIHILKHRLEVIEEHYEEKKININSTKFVKSNLFAEIAPTMVTPLLEKVKWPLIISLAAVTGIICLSLIGTCLVKKNINAKVDSGLQCIRSDRYDLKSDLQLYNNETCLSVYQCTGPCHYLEKQIQEHFESSRNSKNQIRK